jgi:hypothetical protein
LYFIGVELFLDSLTILLGRGKLAANNTSTSLLSSFLPVSAPFQPIMSSRAVDFNLTEAFSLEDHERNDDKVFDGEDDKRDTN